jgi:hypothetical protein
MSEQVATVVAPAIGVKEVKAIQVSGTLRGNTNQKASEVKTLNIALKDINDIQILFTGAWDGHLLKGVIRNIEKAYKHLKVNAMRENIAKEQKRQLLTKKLEAKV